MSEFRLRINDGRSAGLAPAADAAGSGPAPRFDDRTAGRVADFHAAIPGYAPTPLVALDGLARELGVDAVWVKDESTRFGLKAFKGLGASWAIERLLVSEGAEAFVTATDGNHGRAVAWAARRVGGRAVIYLPAASTEARAWSMRALGAEVRRVDGTYDDAVAAAAAAAGDELRLVQDMAWPGYEQIPAWIMEGYVTLIEEALDELAPAEPTHVLLPCGVGSFAAAVIGRLLVRSAGRPPAAVLIEPLGAACATAAFDADAEEPPLLPGDTHTFMACLSCGQLSHGAWPIVRRGAHSVVAIPDRWARRGMRRLAIPIAGDPPVESGESGAVGIGLLDAVLAGEAPAVREGLELGPRSRLLVVSTEGATDPDVYRAVVDADSR